MSDDKRGLTIFDEEDEFALMLGRVLHEEQVKNLMTELKLDSFTTEQYRTFVDRDLKNRHNMPARCSYDTESARRCLIGYKVMREVAPDVWGLLY